MRVVVVTAQVPFVRGGAEIHAEGLVNALCEAGHEAEIVSVPFQWNPPERILNCMLASRLLDLTESSGQPIDRVIGLKFPAYLIPHPNKVLWILHQHRTAYELWDTPYCDLRQFPNGIQVKEAIINADNKSFAESASVFTNSLNVSKRLKRFNQVDSHPLYHPPPQAEIFYCQDEQDYLFFPSRLNTVKRQEFVLEALTKTKNPVKVLFAGNPDEQNYENYLLNLTKKLRISKRATFLGGISDKEKFKYYAEALGVIYPPYDEDYGYVTLEAMLASKPAITCKDSGGPIEFVHHEKTGLTVEPTPEAMASAMDRLWENRSWAKALGKTAREYYRSLDISWSNVVKKLLS